MDQATLFEDNVYDALEQLVAALGGPKRVGYRLWPDKGVEASAKDLRNSLSPHHRAKLDLFDLIKLLQWGQAEGVHVAMHRICNDAGYESPKPVDREQHVNELQKQFISATKQLDAISKELKANGVRLEAV